MKLQKQAFEEVIRALKQTRGFVYDRNARLFLGSEGTRYPQFRENWHLYFMYAAISGKTLPLERGIVTSIIDLSKKTKPPEGCKLPLAYNLGISYHFNKPLEVLAVETRQEERIKPKWDILMLRAAGDSEGYIQKSFAEFLAKK